MNFIEEIIEDRTDDHLMFRFPPEPNGYLHLGHAKAMCLNFGLAEKYKTACNLRMDDTNPLAESEEYVEAIKNDVDWMGFKYSLTRTSDHFDLIFDCALVLIRKGLAYVDDSTSEEIASMKGDLENPGSDSPYRNRTTEENLALFIDMKLKGRKSVLRAKIDMAHPNLIMRDPVIYRLVEDELYPMYDFSHPITDWAEWVSHSLCTLEFEVHRPFYNWTLESLELKGVIPRQIEFSRLNMTHTVMSKRVLKELVDSGAVDGWDDPRMPTISGLRRRGFTPHSIKDFCDRVGVTKVEGRIDHRLLENCLREELNKESNRIMVVIDPIKLTIKNWDKGVEYLDIENNPESDTAGTRSVPFSKNLYIEREDFREEANRKYHRLKLGGEVRLKSGYVVKAIGCIKDSDGNIVEVICEYDPESRSGKPLDRKVKGTIHWVSLEHCEPIEVRDYDVLFLESAPKTIESFNEDSIVVHTDSVAEPAINSVSSKYPVQFMRKGYYILDDKMTDNHIVMNRAVDLRSSFKE